MSDGTISVHDTYYPITTLFNGHDSCCYGSRIKKEDLRDLNETLFAILEKNEDLHNFINSVAVMSRDKFFAVRHYKALASDPLDVSPDAIWSDDQTNPLKSFNRHTDYPNDTVVFSNFGIEQLGQLFKGYNRRYSNNPRHDNCTIFTFFKNKQTLEEYCVNLDPNLGGIKGSYINVLKIKEMYESRYDRLTEQVEEFYFVGRRNMLLAVSLTCGNLIIRYNLYKKIRDVHGEKFIRKLLTNVLKRFSRFSSALCRMNMKTLDGDLQNVSFNKIIRQVKGDKLGVNMQDTGFDVKTAKRLSVLVKKVIKESIEDTPFSNETIKTTGSIVKDILASAKLQMQKAVDNAYNAGLAINNKLARYGWEHAGPNEIPGGAGPNSIWWKRKIDLVPDKFVRDNIT